MVKFQSIKVQKALLNNYDISENIRNITIYNSIDSAGYTLEILYNDVSDIRNKMPLRGGEKLELIMENNIDIVNNTINKFKKTFILLNVVNQIIDEHNVFLKLSFISYKSFLLTVNRVYKSYNSTITNIINTFMTCTTITKDINIQQIIIPGFSKAKAIRYLSGFLDSYFFFETNDSYRFEYINDLIVKSKYDYTPTPNNPTYQRIILDIDYITQFNILEESYNSIYNNIIHTFNPSTKSFSISNIDIKTLQTDSMTFGSGLDYNPDLVKLLDSQNVISPYYPDVFTSQKNSYSLFNKTVCIIVYGDITLQVGDSLNLILKDRFNDNPSRDSGNYLISKISHHISNSEYICKIQLSKNAPYKDVLKSDNLYQNVVI